jgi:hypothetical protein
MTMLTQTDEFVSIPRLEEYYRGPVVGWGHNIPRHWRTMRDTSGWVDVRE